MKRDMELVRQILLAIEAHKDMKQKIKPEIEGYSEEQIMYHVKILADAGLIEAIDVSSHRGGGAEFYDLFCLVAKLQFGNANVLEALLLYSKHELENETNEIWKR